ncbi:MAG: class IV adenylate cyclase [Candidatus Marinimicrobia bacterium]|nr:class IV adenylate cyclase [Candidatus Neomarinimicrobiota bacterium]MCF7827747.1 class IV adenylate cyclase [Candidatus Neomarinimicrobiota bacterium]MCF7881453.1 class IV adenylate cyclase [Candidatus Neomarinimicrobiota bacterium]
MPSNIEIKAHIRDTGSLERKLRELVGDPVSKFTQKDTFFNAPYGRLKLRESPDSPPELIYYERDDTPDPTESRYNRMALSEMNYFAEILSASLGIRGVVEKKRKLYQYKNTRIHLDTVEDLGTFVELEVELTDNLSREEGHQMASQLMASLGIQETDLIDKAYIDLLEERQKQ